jgi:hypothetical protein
MSEHRSEARARSAVSACEERLRDEPEDMA